MPGKILGIDIAHDYVTAVQVISGLKGYQVTACYHSLIKEDGGLEEALGGLSRTLDLKSDNYIASMPGDNFSYRNIKLPFKEPKKIRQALPFEMETLVPFPIDDLIVDFIILDQSNASEVLAVSAKKAYIAGYLGILRAHGIDPDILDIGPIPTISWLMDQEGTAENGLFLDIGLNRNSMVLFQKRKIVLIRHLPFNNRKKTIPGPSVGDNPPEPWEEHMEYRMESLCTAVKNTVHSFGWQVKRTVELEKIYFGGMGAGSGMEKLFSRLLEIPAQRVEVSHDRKVSIDKKIADTWNPTLMDNALALALRDPKKGHGFSLRRGEFEIRKHHLGPVKEIRKAAALLILVLLFLIFDLSADYVILKKEYKTADQKVTEIFKQTFPELIKVRYPILQMKQKIDEMENSAVLLPALQGREHKVLDLLKDISQRVPESLGIDITNMVFDPDTVRITGETDTYDTVDSLKNSLEPSPYFDSVTISSANLDRTGKKVNFEIKIQREKQ